MPDPFDRHARPGDGWEAQPSRSQLRRAAAMEDGGDSRAVDDPLIVAKRAPGRKDRNLCKAAHWKGPHQPEIRPCIDPFTNHGRECGWDASWRQDKPVWVCRHEEVCTGCLKVLRGLLGRDDCPDFRPITEDERERIGAEIASRREWRQSRKPVITGHQGYRRKRGAA